MRSFLAFSAFVALVSSAEWNISQPLNQWADEIIPHYAPEITTIEENKAYVVKLDCPGCPFAIKTSDSEVEWQEPPQENALRLQFEIDAMHSSTPSLLLNGRRILPLDPLPLNINAYQVPTNISAEEMQLLWQGPTSGVQLPLQYEHTVLRTQENGKLWVQFDVTGLPLSESNDPRFPFLNGDLVKLDMEEQKLVQVLLRNETNDLSIEDIQVVARKDRAQPYRMKCGRLAMVQTAFDPTEWDEYGKFGTESRLQNMVASKIGEVWSDGFQRNSLLLPVGLLLAFGAFMLRRWYVRRQDERRDVEDDAEIALLNRDYEDAPPAYADIPVIKIEEYD
ncbi:hypothetical protein BKA63DRAFT_404309 [Paraphoma chrysanthemicola]|nr:hypothetical protein BKA63DRAFT_404309 [Paraphoma chrysanthemicola]